MSDATIVAVVILVGVFVLMSFAIIKHGIDGAVRLWGIMGALTGVAFGSITSYYFTNKYNQQEIRQVKAEKNAIELALNNAINKAIAANKIIVSIPQTKTTELPNKIEKASAQLKAIEESTKVSPTYGIIEKDLKFKPLK
jgi:uncharacterized membrane protein required for colicin V production